MTADAATLPIALTGPLEITFAYVDAAGGPTDVRWTQIARATTPATWTSCSRGAGRRTRSPGTLPPGAVAPIASEAMASLAGASPVTVHSPLWWFIGGDGSLSGGPDPDFVEFAGGRRCRGVAGDPGHRRRRLAPPGRRSRPAQPGGCSGARPTPQPRERTASTSTSRGSATRTLRTCPPSSRRWRKPSTNGEAW